MNSETTVVGQHNVKCRSDIWSPMFNQFMLKYGRARFDKKKKTPMHSRDNALTRFQVTVTMTFDLQS